MKINLAQRQVGVNSKTHDDLLEKITLIKIDEKNLIFGRHLITNKVVFKLALLELRNRFLALWRPIAGLFAQPQPPPLIP